MADTAANLRAALQLGIRIPHHVLNLPEIFTVMWLYNLLHSAWTIFFLAGCLWSLTNLAGPEIAKRWPPFRLILICQYVAYKQWGGIGIEICLVAFVGVPLSIFHHWSYAVDVQELE